MKKPPKRLFRDRRPSPQVHDLRRCEFGREPIVAPPVMPVDFDPATCLVYMAVHEFVKTNTWNCVQALRDLDFEVHLSTGASAIDMSRCLMASEAVVGGFEQLLFIDSDVMFGPESAVRLFLRPEPVVAGVYATKAYGPKGRLNVDFGPGVLSQQFGPLAGDQAVPVLKVGAGFLRIKVDFLKRMIKKLQLPYCLMGHSAGWPFFLPMVIEEEGALKYLPEDYAFCRRCCDAGEPPMVDTTFRVYHLGETTFGLEEAQGQYVERVENQVIHFDRPLPVPVPEPEI